MMPIPHDYPETPGLRTACLTDMKLIPSAHKSPQGTTVPWVAAKEIL